MLDPRSHPRLGAVDQALELLGDAALSNPLIGEVRRPWRLGPDQLLLRGIRAVTEDALLLAMKQVRQRVLVMYVRRSDHSTVRKAGLAVHADVQFHTEVPLLALAGLVHLGVPFLLGVLGGARRSDDGGVHDSSGTDLQPVRLQHLA